MKTLFICLIAIGLYVHGFCLYTLNKHIDTLAHQLIAQRYQIDIISQEIRK